MGENLYTIPYSIFKLLVSNFICRIIFLTKIDSFIKNFLQHHLEKNCKITQFRFTYIYCPHLLNTDFFLQNHIALINIFLLTTFFVHVGGILYVYTKEKFIKKICEKCDPIEFFVG